MAVKNVNDTLHKYVFSNDVHVGPWANYAQPPFFRPTITVKASVAPILIGFISIFIKTCGDELWSLMSYAIHQYRSTQRPRDGLYHQQQAILRNSASDTKAFLKLGKISYFWRRRASQGLYRSSLLMLAAALHFAAFWAASLLASKMAQPVGEVRLKGDRCGNWNLNQTTDPARHGGVSNAGDAVLLQYRRDMKRTLDYVRSCYRQESPYPGACESYLTKKFDSKISRNASCPFGEDICYPLASGYMQIDSGDLNSAHDLGINARQEDRVTVRRTLSCAPLTTTGHLSDGWVPPINATDDSSDGLMLYYYGNSGQSYDDKDGVTQFAMTDYTWFYRNSTRQANSFSNSQPFQVFTMTGAETVGTDTDFMPIAQLQKNDATVSLTFLTDFAYTEYDIPEPWLDTQDPWFKNIFTSEQYGNQTIPGVMGCIEQIQFCNPSADPSANCTKMLPMDFDLNDETVSESFKSVNLNDRQNATIQLIITQSTFSFLLMNWEPGVTGLVAQDSLIDRTGTIKTLPADQWKVEVENLFNLTMVALQQQLTSFARGPTDPGLDYWITNITEPALKDLCHQIIVKDPNYTSFYAGPLILVLVFGVVLFLTSACIDHIVGFAQTKLRKGEYPKQEWQSGDFLQLQRMAFEAQGHGAWKRDDGIPVTERGQKFPMPKRGGAFPGAFTSSDVESGVVPFSEKVPQQVVVRGT